MTTQDTVISIFKSENRNITLDDAEDFDSPFQEVGIDSLDLMMSMLKICEQFNIEMNEQAFEEIETINELVAFLDDNKA